jgi:hypothetical protein
MKMLITPVKKLGRGAMNGSIVPLSLFLFGWMKQQQLHLWCKCSCNCFADLKKRGLIVTKPTLYNETIVTPP